ncbi:hypothetical protein PFISCL1PPCAC_28436, partial [Pristionchus fissidentatus]
AEALLEELTRRLTPAPIHLAPPLTRAGFLKQAEFNCSVLNKLEQVRKDPSLIDGLIETIKERNAALTMADKNPKLLEVMETARAFEGSASATSPLMQAMVLAQSLANQNDRKRRATSPPPQPFRTRASAYGQAGFFSGNKIKKIAEAVERSEPNLLPVLFDAIEGARAPATMRSYRGSIKKLRDFAIDRGLDPSCPTSLIIYSLQKVNEGKALSTLRTLSAAFTHFVSPPPPILSQILSNIHHTTRRLIPVAHHAHVPREHIDCLIQYATNHPEDLSSLRTAVGAALSFSALLRVSELLALQWEDLLWSSGYLRLTIRRAKNDQFSEGRNTFVSIVESSPTFSLFHAYKERVPSSVWVFPSLSNPELPLKPDSFRQGLALLCAHSGLERITPHQLRSGGAMESLKNGASHEAVQRRGRWKSSGGLAAYISDTVDTQGGALPL